MNEGIVNMGLQDKALTDAAFWDAYYSGRDLNPFSDADWRNYVSIQLVRLLIRYIAGGVRAVCELGGGDGKIVSYLARKRENVKFSILDISPEGCALARARAETENVALDVYCADVFNPPSDLLGSFDLLYSLGVVEHFSDLSQILFAKKLLINPMRGRIFTLIPNLDSPIYARLCRRWSRSVWEAHVPHSMKTLLEGHMQAGLRPVEYGYLGSVEFGMLSMSINGPEPKSTWDRKLYLWLTRISKAVHFVEYRSIDLPATRLFSPFMYVVSEPNQ